MNLQSSSAPVVVIERVTQINAEDHLSLCELLLEVVQGGASVGFMLPLTLERVDRFWRGVDHELQRGNRALFLAREGAAIIGTAQLITDLPDNQPHRADIAKVLVRPGARRKGVGELLMQAAQQHAKDLAKTLLVLDTASDDARRLYARLGWQVCGDIPNYALLPDGALCGTTYYYKSL